MLRFLSSATIIIWSISSLFGQQITEYCGSTYKESNYKVHQFQNEDCTLGLTSIPIALTFIMPSDSASLYYEGLEDEIMDTLLHDFLPSGIHPYLCAEPVFIYSDALYDYTIGDEDIQLLYPGVSSDRINVIIPSSLSLRSGAQFCGIDRILPFTVFSRYSCIPSHTISHEIGHFLGLLHTHETNAGGIEFVNGSNCETAGDHICDTPADPYRLDLVDRDCTWRGTYEDELGYDIDFLDPNGDKYETDVSNIMSYYGVFGCRNSFTPQQSYVMHDGTNGYPFGYENIYTAFEVYEQESICDVGYRIAVKVSRPKAGVNYQWDIDSDGTYDYSGTDIQHLYATHGRYTITLSMQNQDGTSYHKSEVCIINYSNTAIKAPFIDDFQQNTTRDHVSLIEEGPYIWRLGLRLAGPGGRKVALDQIHINENSIMEYKIDISTLENPELVFDYNSDTDELVGGDTLLIELFSCGNQSVKLFEKVGADLGTDGMTLTEVFQLPDVNTDQIQIRFTTKGDDTFWHELFIDNIEIREGSPTNTNQFSAGDFKIYPNPVKEILTVETSKNISHMDLIDIYGHILLSYDHHVPIDLSQIDQGIYFIRIHSGEEVVVQRVIKSH